MTLEKAAEIDRMILKTPPMTIKSGAKQEELDRIYWNPEKVLSYNRIFNFIIGARGVGKTFGMKRFVINRFKRTGAQFVWVRRYRTEMTFAQAFFSDIAYLYPKDNLTVKGNKAFCNGKEMGVFMALSVSAQKKSTPFPNTETVVFDEFIIDKGSLHYLKNEAEVFLELFETVARLRDNVRAVFLANAISITNPYFLYFNAFPRKNTVITCTESIAIENVSRIAYTNLKKETRFGKLVKDTPYFNYAIENEYLRSNDDFVLHEKPKKLEYICGLTYRGKSLGVYSWEGHGLVINSKYDPQATSFAVTMDDGKINQPLIFSTAFNPFLDTLKEYFRRSLTFYENGQTKALYFEIMTFLSVRG